VSKGKPPQLWTRPDLAQVHPTKSEDLPFNQNWKIDFAAILVLGKMPL
jgi:hypothetical protein